MNRLTMLRRTDLFGALSVDKLLMVERAFEAVHYQAGETICREGEPARYFFLISRGTARVEKNSGETNIILSELRSGDHFGAMALLDLTPRSASVVATTDCALLRLNSSQFFTLLMQCPELTSKLICGFAVDLRRSMESAMKM
jgi:CRP-like cAMP-binding protein